MKGSRTDLVNTPYQFFSTLPAHVAFPSSLEALSRCEIALEQRDNETPKLTGDLMIRYAAIAVVFVYDGCQRSNKLRIFRAQNLRLSFIIGLLIPIMDVALFVCLVQLDRFAAWALVSYLLYRIYAVWWGFALWKLNRPSTI
jgi:hypothetical protein